MSQITQSLIVRTAQAHMSWLSEFLFPTSIALDSNAGAPERGARGGAAAPHAFSLGGKGGQLPFSQSRTDIVKNSRGWAKSLKKSLKIAEIF